MDITELTEPGYEKVVRCVDRATGLLAFIAVHDTTLGPALGGMRMLPYASEDEAIFDVKRLSRGMTYKSAVANTGLGGGKSVIMGDPAGKTPELFHAMGRFVDSLGGKYITAEDMNIGIADLQQVKKTTQYVTGLSREEGGSGNPSPYTARGVVMGMRAVLEEVFGSDSFEGRTILIQGVGAVGQPMATDMKARGAKILVCDIDEKRAARFAEEHGFQHVPDLDHHKHEVDVYAPCARGAGVNDRTIGELRCKAIAGCANNILLEPRHGDELKAKGILYAPDYVINAGGIINVGIEVSPGGYNEAVAIERIDGIYDNLKEVFQIAREENIGTEVAADRLAERRLEAARQAKQEA
ncbi:Glu/Leu/Phe/Val family dehydrogenase [Engelhardtia mirabilis]|uniref:Leucine dehydrogenase n=1 Tax=Engelhardtia mirabilis TaxID=2528011 RepID=A0A518BFJ7_9BACT|nr:Leucine dehydrogenase [Planctomycetes bacterium Pla133]QDV00085.1 Leucine dehydrogenase [Planctomycetes bacterium Pla86]